MGTDTRKDMAVQDKKLKYSPESRYKGIKNTLNMELNVCKEDH
jgi:hypothetical protein